MTFLFHYEEVVDVGTEPLFFSISWIIFFSYADIVWEFASRQNDRTVNPISGHCFPSERRPWDSRVECMAVFLILKLCGTMISNAINHQPVWTSVISDLEFYMGFAHPDRPSIGVSQFRCLEKGMFFIYGFQATFLLGFSEYWFVGFSEEGFFFLVGGGLLVQ